MKKWQENNMELRIIPPKLNIGCGYEKKEGFINLDKAKEVKPDIVCNIEEGLPFPDNHFKYIYSEHCLEHIRPDKWKFVLNEIARVSKDGCVLELLLPFDNMATRTNCDHYRTFGFMSFDPLMVGGGREYYSDLKLTNMIMDTPKLTKLWYYLFPFLKKEIGFVFRIVKK